MLRAGFSLLVSALLTQLVGAAAPADLAKLTAGLNAPKAEEQYAAADALTDLGYAAQGAVPQLLAAFEKADPELRWRVARALGATGDLKLIGNVPQYQRMADGRLRRTGSVHGGIFDLTFVKDLGDESPNIGMHAPLLGDHSDLRPDGCRQTKAHCPEP